MTTPRPGPEKKLLLSAIVGKNGFGDNIPSWMDRKYGYTTKVSRKSKQRKRSKR